VSVLFLGTAEPETSNVFPKDSCDVNEEKIPVLKLEQLPLASKSEVKRNKMAKTKVASQHSKNNVTNEDSSGPTTTITAGAALQRRRREKTQISTG
jgi:hypothetical protein